MPTNEIATDETDFIRMPGLYRAWEVQHLLESGRSYQIEDAGPEGTGDTLFAVYRSGSNHEVHAVQPPVPRPSGAQASPLGAQS